MSLMMSSVGKKTIVDIIYPVGSIYISTSNITPESVFGGTWESIRGKFLLSESDGHPAGSTGGEETHTLTAEELPLYTNARSYSAYTDQPNTSGWVTGNPGSNMAYGRLKVGGDQPHNNMPPYISVYMWKRIS